jgi:hypothetical protein
MFHPAGDDRPAAPAFAAEIREFAADSMAFKLLT